MIINKIIYKNGIMEIHHSILKEGGKEDYYTIRSGDIPLPSFQNNLLRLRPAVVEILELPNTDEEVKKITIDKVSFDYSGEESTMGAVISGRRELKLSGAKMAINTPHKFAKKAKGQSSAVFDKKTIELLENLQTEAIKYIEGERQQGELFKKDQPAAEPIKDKKSKKKTKSKKKEEKKDFKLNNIGPENAPVYAIKAKGKYVTIGGPYAVKLNALVGATGILQDSEVHEGMKEMGYAGNKILFETDGKSLMHIYSALVDHRQVNNEDLARNVIEELIDEMVEQPTLRFIPAANVGADLMQSVN